MDETRSIYAGLVPNDLASEPCAIRRGRPETRYALERPGSDWHPYTDDTGEEEPGRWERRWAGTGTDPRALVQWLHVHAPGATEAEPQLVGKWLLHLPCEHVARCWGLVRDATLDGRLGVAAKVSTDFGNELEGSGPLHVICVYSADWRDERDVLRIAGELKRIDAVRTMTLSYKPDLFTYAGTYAGNTAGAVAIYTARPPYERLVIKPAAARAVGLLADQDFAAYVRHVVERGRAAARADRALEQLNAVLPERLRLPPRLRSARKR